MLEVRTMPIADLAGADYNPRTPLAPGARSRLRRSLTRFGLVEPLVWNARTRRLVGGHARLDLLRELGHAEVPVAVVNLSEPEEKALNVVLNNREAQGRFDPDKLRELLDELAPLPEFADTGFTTADLTGLRLEPAQIAAEDEPPTGVEVRLTLTEHQYEELSPTLTAWLAAGVTLTVRPR